MNPRMVRLPAPLFRAVLHAALAMSIAPMAGAATRKVVDRAQADTASLAAMHAVVLEEYESFVLVEMPDEAPAAGAEKSAGPRAVPGTRIALRDYPIDTTSLSAMMAPDVPAQLTIADYAAETRGLYLVQFYGPIKEAWLDALKAAGAEVVEYMPEYAYVVRMTPAQRQLVASGDVVPRGVTGRSPVQWTGVFQPAYRLSKTLVGRSGPVTTSILVIDDADGRALAERLLKEGTPVQPITSLPPYIGFKVTLDAERLPGLASDPSVYFIDQWSPPVLLCEPGAMNMAGLRVNGEAAGFGLAGVPWLTWLATHGFTSSQVPDFLVNITDTGLDKGKKTGKWHKNLYAADGVTSRVAYTKDWTADAGTANDGVDGTGHGTSCAGIIAGHSNVTGTGTGEVSSAGYQFGLGVDPFARIGGSKIFRFDGSWGLGYHTFTEVETYAYTQGARISSNSWGTTSTDGLYNTDAMEYDFLVRDSGPTSGNQGMIVFFAAGDSDDEFVTATAAAKNVITVGAAENWWPSYSTCGWPAAMQNTPGDDIMYQSRSGTWDRVKPEVVAIGQGWNTLRGQFAATPACGAPMDTASTSLYTRFGGTSAAAPAAAGVAALFYQWAKSHWGAAPSPALTKAVLAGTARDLVGGTKATRPDGTGGVISDAPNYVQGWGLVDLGRVLDGTPSLAFDQQTLLTKTGNRWTVTVPVADPAKPVRIALAWTDAPGNVGSVDAFQNDLTLSVTAGGSTYYGNGRTTTFLDYADNLETVTFGAGRFRSVTITVTASNLVADGVPNNSTSIDQDFALYVYNGAAPCTPTAAPANVTASATGDNRITLAWSAAAGNTDGYSIYRTVDSYQPYTLVGTVPKGTVSFVDTGVIAGTTYQYRVTSGIACESAAGSASAKGTGPCVRPPSPFSVSVTDKQMSTCRLEVSFSSWSNCGSPLPQLVYDVYRSTDPDFVPGPSNLLRAHVLDTGRYFYDQFGVAPDTTYYYYVKATDADRGAPWTMSSRGSGRTSGVPPKELLASSTMSVPNGTEEGSYSTSWLSDDLLISSARLSVTSNHVRAGDLVLRLLAPSGQTITVHNRTGSGQFGQREYDVTYVSDGPGSMADLVGQNTVGPWKFLAADLVPDADLSAYLSWSLRLGTQKKTCTAGDPAFPGEASPAGNMRLERGPGTSLVMSYTPAEHTTDTVVYAGSVSAGGYSWRTCFPRQGHSGKATFDDPTSAYRQLTVYVPVGTVGDYYEGSYGRDSSGREIPKTGTTGCSYVQLLP